MKTGAEWKAILKDPNTLYEILVALTPVIDIIVQKRIEELPKGITFEQRTQTLIDKNKDYI